MNRYRFIALALLFIIVFGANIAQAIDTKKIAQENNQLSLIDSTKTIQPEKSGFLSSSIMNNRERIITLYLVLFVITIHTFIWLIIGRDPPSGTIMPNWQIPENLSPGAISYIYHMGFESASIQLKSFISSLIRLSNLGYIQLKRDGPAVIVRRKYMASKGLATEEWTLLKKLFRHSETVNLLYDHRDVSYALQAYTAALANAYHCKMFKKNSVFVLLGVILSLITYAYSVLSYPTGNLIVLIFSLTHLLGFSLLLIILIPRLYKSFLINPKGFYDTPKIFIALIFFIIAAMIYASVFMFKLFIVKASIFPLIIFIILLMINHKFFKWMKQPTKEGQNIIDQIAGFRQFLSLAEEKRLNILMDNNKALPKDNIRFVSQYLPYCLALDLENNWSEQFKDIFDVTQDSAIFFIAKFIQ